MTSQKKDPSLRSILLSLFGFVLLWAIVTDAWGYSSHLAINGGSYIYAFLSRLIWVAPAFWLISRHNAFLIFRKNTLLSRLVWNRSLVIALAVSLLIPFAGMLVTHGGFWINASVSIPLEIAKIMMVGFVEEIVFRGWGYNALAASVTDQKAILYATVFFVLLHWPAYFVRYYRFGTMDVSSMLIQSFSAAVCGVWFCWLLKKGKNLWNPIIVHIVYDVFVTLLVG